MCDAHVFDRRDGLLLLAGAALGALAPAGHALSSRDDFIREAFRQRDIAIAAGDQPYGAVVVFDDRIVGFGASRVITDSNADAHAERVALWAAQRAVARPRLDGATIYSSSLPCDACQRELAAAGVARMVHGREALDAGAPRNG